MPPAAKRQKTSAATARSAPRITRGLGAFTRVSKAGTSAQAFIRKTDSIDAISTISCDDSAIGNKRKAVDILEGQDTEIIHTNDEREIKSLRVKPFRASGTFLQTPSKASLPLGSNFSSDASFTSGTTCLSRPHNVFPETSPRSLLGSTFESRCVGRSRPPREIHSPLSIPIEILDLINLHAAFLTALSLHYAHNGVSSPADVRMLCQSIASTWGKRRVTLEDIRRTIGTMKCRDLQVGRMSMLSTLHLSNYGEGKICIEIGCGGNNCVNTARPMNEDLMNDAFVKAVREAWERKSQEDVGVLKFISSLPMEPISTCESLAKISPLLAKGQQRLVDMKAVVREKLQGEVTMMAEPRTSLLERLRAKHHHRLTLPPPPTKAALKRKAALHDLAEVVALLNILSTSSSIGQSRMSFTMPTVLSKLSDSSRRVFSKEKGDMCIRLLASEIAPEWVQLVKRGKLEAVVMMREQRPLDMEIQERIRRAL